MKQEIEQKRVDELVEWVEYCAKHPISNFHSLSRVFNYVGYTQSSQIQLCYVGGPKTPYGIAWLANSTGLTDATIEWDTAEDAIICALHAVGVMVIPSKTEHQLKIKELRSKIKDLEALADELK